MPVQIFLNDPLKLEILSDEIVAAWPNQPFSVSDHSSYCEGMKIRWERIVILLFVWRENIRRADRERWENIFCRMNVVCSSGSLTTITKVS